MTTDHQELAKLRQAQAKAVQNLKQLHRVIVALHRRNALSKKCTVSLKKAVDNTICILDVDEQEDEW